MIPLSSTSDKETNNKGIYLQEFSGNFWQKYDKSLLILVSYRAPWFGQWINEILSNF